MTLIRTITKIFISIKFENSPQDPCVFVTKINKKVNILLLINVDDILIASSSEKAVNDTVDELEMRFSLKHLGFPIKFIGIEIERITQNSILLHNEERVNSLLNEYKYDTENLNQNHQCKN